jgi:hypothetical protein
MPVGKDARTDSHLANHAHVVMQGALVREDSGVQESDAETCHANGQLWQPAPFLKRLNYREISKAPPEIK